jgi:hypothetical protein
MCEKNENKSQILELRKSLDQEEYILLLYTYYKLCLKLQSHEFSMSC